MVQFLFWEIKMFILYYCGVYGISDDENCEYTKNH